MSANPLKLKGNLAKIRVQPTPSVGEVNLGLSKVKHSKSDPGRTQKVSQSHETNWVRLWSDTKCLTETVQLFKFNLDRTRNLAHLVALFAINYQLNALQGKLLWSWLFLKFGKMSRHFPTRNALVWLFWREIHPFSKKIWKPSNYVTQKRFK